MKGGGLLDLKELYLYTTMYPVCDVSLWKGIMWWGQIAQTLHCSFMAETHDEQTHNAEHMMMSFLYMYTYKTS